jgi:hypothetical protein
MKKVFFFFLFIIFLASLSLEVSSQCAMCRRTAETSQQADENKSGRGLNAGILYLLSIPYILGGVGAFFWYKNRKK